MNTVCKKGLASASGLALIGAVSTGVCAAEQGVMSVPYASEPLVVDGQLDESWSDAKWYPMDFLMAGVLPSKEDFSGEYSLRWDESYLYLTVRIQDDVIFDQHADPLYFYWDDDCLEIFIDADASGGDHQFSFNAFAYHVALDNQSVDIGEKNADGSPQFLLLNDHVDSEWKREEEKPNYIIWEAAIAIHDDSFSPGQQPSDKSRMTLTAGHVMGFMLAYCDNDGSENREHFMGSHSFPAVNGDRNLGYKDASVFGKIKLVAP